MAKRPRQKTPTKNLHVHHVPLVKLSVFFNAVSLFLQMAIFYLNWRSERKDHSQTIHPLRFSHASPLRHPIAPVIAELIARAPRNTSSQ